MNRKRPRQHTRRLKSGKVITINKGRKPKKKRAMATWDYEDERDRVNRTFNEMITNQEKEGPNPVNIAALNAYNQALRDAGLLKITKYDDHTEVSSLKDYEPKRRR